VIRDPLHGVQSIRIATLLGYENHLISLKHRKLIMFNLDKSYGLMNLDVS